MRISLLQFNEGYFERVWGGARLRTLYQKPIPSEHVGEAWLISDHPSYVSTVIQGPLKGTTLRELLDEDAPQLMGARPRLTVHGRFPLLLKILDAVGYLSVQVHPDDQCAAALGEPDVGKTEMWHILHAERGSEIICGLEPAMEPDAFLEAVQEGKLDRHLVKIAARDNDSILINAGTVHAIGPGLVIAEIQQNSDLTYRIYDWNRGKRELHLDKARKAIHFHAPVPGARPEIHLDAGDARRSFLAACEYFAAEEVTLNGTYRRNMAGETFHILLAKSGLVNFNDGEYAARLFPGQALLVPGALSRYEASGTGSFLDYYVPDIKKDILLPLLDHGFEIDTLRSAGLVPSG
jgi:mannose-6-phosphate isomerase